MNQMLSKWKDVAHETLANKIISGCSYLNHYNYCIALHRESSLLWLTRALSIPLESINWWGCCRKILWLVVRRLRKIFHQICFLHFAFRPQSETPKQREISLLTRFIHLIIVMEIRPECISLQWYRYWLFLCCYFFENSARLLNCNFCLCRNCNETLKRTRWMRRNCATIIMIEKLHWHSSQSSSDIQIMSEQSKMILLPVKVFILFEEPWPEEHL